MKLSLCDKNLSCCYFFTSVFIATTALVAVHSSCTRYDVTEHEIRQNQSADDSLTFLKDDSLSALSPPVFDSSMEVFDMNTGYNINKSAAVFRLACG